MSQLDNQSTRLLAAAVVLGKGGARSKVLAWLKNPSRAVAPELGIDLRLIAQLARAADRRDRNYQWSYFAVWVAGLIVYNVPHHNVFHYVGVVIWSAGLSTLGRPLIGLLTWMPDVVVIGVLISGGICAYRKIQERGTFAPMFRPDRFNPEEVAQRFPGKLAGNELGALPQQDQNFFVYSGFTPFTGAGADLGGWSVPIALDKPKHTLGTNAEIQPFVVADLYGALDRGIRDLDVHGVELKDCFFAAGTDLRDERPLLPNIYGRPVQRLDGATEQSYLHCNNVKVRHYRCYRILDWGGELALSYYLRCSKRGNMLFIETKRFLLTPIACPYRGVDEIRPLKLAGKATLVAQCLVIGPVLVAVSPLWVYAKITRKLRNLFSSEEKRHRKLIDESPLYNYGAEHSLREACASAEQRHYFQKTDGDFYNKLFEREVLDTLVEFLDAHGIDTSDLKERQTTILNSGVIVQGGDVKAENLSVGAGSTAIKKVTSAFKPAAKGGSK